MAQNKFKVVVCDYEYPNVDEETKIFNDMGNVTFIPSQCKTKEEIIALTRDADGVLNQWSKLTKEVIDQMERCKVIATYGIGFDKIDVEAAAQKGIVVCNVPDYCMNEVANHTLTLIMACSRQLMKLDHNIRAGKWSYKNINTKLYRMNGKTAGLLGFGKIPRNLAKKLQALGMNVIAYDPFVTDEQMKEAGVKKADVETLMKESDYISVHVPLNKATRYMISYKEIGLMKPTAYLINAGRGAIVEEAALLKALEEKKIAGTALDVFEEEPMKPDNPFLQFDNVIVSPHAAWYTEEAILDLQRGAAMEVARVLKGEAPKSPVNKPVKK